MSDSIPIEILCHIFSFLQYHELYLLRGVCTQWLSLIEEYIYLNVKTQQQPIVITLGQRPFISTMDLFVHSYDSLNKVLEFRPRQHCELVSPLYNNDNNSSSASPLSWQVYHHRQMQIKFSSWPRSYSPSWLQSLSPQEQAQVKLHLLYNPVMECSYALPAYEWLSSSPSLDQHYVGDKSLIMSFSYIPPPVQSNQGVNISSSSSSSSSPPLCAPQIKIHWLRVKLDWIISGFEPKIQPTQIYADRYARLYHTLVYQHGCFKYDELSEPVLSYIIEQQDSSTTGPLMMMQDGVSSFLSKINNKEDISLLPKQLLSYIQEHTHEYQTRLSRLQHMLEGASVDSRMIWKYPFAKSFVIGNGSLLSEEDVLRRIQDSEEEWRLLFGKLKRRFGIL